MAEESVQVAVRIRPLVKSETDRGSQCIITKIANEPQIVVKNHDAFTFNFVFDPEYTQQNIYEDSVKRMIENLFNGYNVTILAYGQTGSGKTHTMGTVYNGNADSDMGVIPRAMYDIFNRIEKLSEDDYKFKVTCSFMELYQEQLFDLLSTQTRENSIVDIKQHSENNKGIIIPNLTEIEVSSAKQTTNCLIRGSEGRSVGSTAMNQHSSRSHAIFTVTIGMMKNNDSKHSTTAKFHLVDLAGSERSKKTMATGDRFKEGVKINQGLLALGNVISALGSGQTNVFVGYRDSKLTRLLQDSLGGNSITLMIACVSPADYNMDETLSTLRYADRARKIKNKPIVNQDPKTAEINRLNALVNKLRLELLANGGSNESLKNNSTSSFQELELMRKQLSNVAEKNLNLQHQLQLTLQDLAEIEMRAIIAQNAHDSLQTKFLQVKELLRNCPSEVTTKANLIDDIKNIMEEIEDIFNHSRKEIQSHNLSVSSNNSVSISNYHIAEDMQQRAEAFTTKSLEINAELKRLNRELNLKEEHHQKVSGNLTNFQYYENNTESIIKESETKISALEAEKTELLVQLRCVKDKPSAKISEERRKRVQLLEQQISDLKKRNLQQAKMLKIREKESQKINNLTKEIQDIKMLKVKLVRAMKSESEKFRQWKSDREKQLTQLKEKDRKMKNEMARKESLYNKQKNVWKRKVEEAMTINKRLKDVLERQKVAQSQRKAAGVQAGKVDQFVKWIDNELEVVISVIDAKHSLDHLIEDRASIAQSLNELKKNCPENEKEIETVEEDLQRRNAQIDDLQQKIIASDIDTKLETICVAMNTMPEARSAVQHLFRAIKEQRRQFIVTDSKLNEFKSICETAEEKVALTEENLSTERKKLLDQISDIQKSYEEKILILLRELNNKEPREEMSTDQKELLKIQQEALDKNDELREELERYKSMYVNLKKANELYRDQKKKRKFSLESSHCESSDENLDDESKDPDWVKTPGLKRSKRTNSFNESKNNSTEGGSIISESRKRNVDGQIKCACKTGCKTKRCKCRSNSTFCSSTCGCDPLKCCNQEIINDSIISIDEDDNNKSANKENHNGVNECEEELSHTPKKFKSENNLDVTTPLYPFSTKKRKPFYE